jgi:hypothetical protein
MDRPLFRFFVWFTDKTEPCADFLGLTSKAEHERKRFWWQVVIWALIVIWSVYWTLFPIDPG